MSYAVIATPEPPEYGGVTVTRYLRETCAETAETVGAFIWFGTVAARIDTMAEGVPSPCAFLPLY
jgi:hypothetical protein